MRITQIGTLVFNSTTNVIVDNMELDIPGVGFHMRTLSGPTPFSVDIAFIRPTRQAVMDAINKFTRELFSYSQRRTADYFARAGGIKITIEDENESDTLSSYLRDGSVTLLGVERASSGVIAKVRLSGMLVGPFLEEDPAFYTFVDIRPYERRVIALPNLNNNALYAQDWVCSLFSPNGVFNILIAIEEREALTASSRIAMFNPTSTIGNLVPQNFNAVWKTGVRNLFSSTSNATFNYTINYGDLSNEAYKLFFEILTPTAPSSNARYVISWHDQPEISETITNKRSWYSPGIYARGESPNVITLQVLNAPQNTLVMPLMFIPVDGAHVYNIVSTPTVFFARSLYPQTAKLPPMEVGTNGPKDSIIYGNPHLITSRFISIFFGMMQSNLSGLSVNIELNSRRIEPAAFI